MVGERSGEGLDNQAEVGALEARSVLEEVLSGKRDIDPALIAELKDSLGVEDSKALKDKIKTVAGDINKGVGKGARRMRERVLNDLMLGIDSSGQEDIKVKEGAPADTAEESVDAEKESAEVPAELPEEETTDEQEDGDGSDADVEAGPSADEQADDDIGEISEQEQKLIEAEAERRGVETIPLEDVEKIIMGARKAGPKNKSEQTEAIPVSHETTHSEEDEYGDIRSNVRERIETFLKLSDEDKKTYFDDLRDPGVIKSLIGLPEGADSNEVQERMLAVVDTLNEYVDNPQYKEMYELFANAAIEGRDKLFEVISKEDTEKAEQIDATLSKLTEKENERIEKSGLSKVMGLLRRNNQAKIATRVLLGITSQFVPGGDYAASATRVMAGAFGLGSANEARAYQKAEDEVLEKYGLTEYKKNEKGRETIDMERLLNDKALDNLSRDQLLEIYGTLSEISSAKGLKIQKALEDKETQAFQDAMENQGFIQKNLEKLRDGFNNLSWKKKALVFMGMAALGIGASTAVGGGVAGIALNAGIQMAFGAVRSRGDSQKEAFSKSSLVEEITRRVDQEELSEEDIKLIQQTRGSVNKRSKKALTKGALLGIGMGVVSSVAWKWYSGRGDTETGADTEARTDTGVGTDTDSTPKDVSPPQNPESFAKENVEPANPHTDFGGQESSTPDLNNENVEPANPNTDFGEQQTSNHYFSNENVEPTNPKIDFGHEQSSYSNENVEPANPKTDFGEQPQFSNDNVEPANPHTDFGTHEPGDNSPTAEDHMSGSEAPATEKSGIKLNFDDADSKGSESLGGSDLEGKLDTSAGAADRYAVKIADGLEDKGQVTFGTDADRDEFIRGLSEDLKSSHSEVFNDDGSVANEDLLRSGVISPEESAKRVTEMINGGHDFLDQDLTHQEISSIQDRLDHGTAETSQNVEATPSGTDTAGHQETVHAEAHGSNPEESATQENPTQFMWKAGRVEDYSKGIKLNDEELNKVFDKDLLKPNAEKYLHNLIDSGRIKPEQVVLTPDGKHIMFSDPSMSKDLVWDTSLKQSGFLGKLFGAKDDVIQGIIDRNEAANSAAQTVQTSVESPADQGTDGPATDTQTSSNDSSGVPATENRSGTPVGGREVTSDNLEGQTANNRELYSSGEPVEDQGASHIEKPTSSGIGEPPNIEDKTQEVPSSDADNSPKIETPTESGQGELDTGAQTEAHEGVVGDTALEHKEGTVSGQDATEALNKYDDVKYEDIPKDALEKMSKEHPDWNEAQKLLSYKRYLEMKEMAGRLPDQN